MHTLFSSKFRHICSLCNPTKSPALILSHPFLCNGKGAVPKIGGDVSKRAQQHALQVTTRVAHPPRSVRSIRISPMGITSLECWEEQNPPVGIRGTADRWWVGVGGVRRSAIATPVGLRCGVADGPMRMHIRRWAGGCTNMGPESPDRSSLLFPSGGA